MGSSYEGDKMENENTSLTVGEAIQFSNDVLYYETQLSIISKDFSRLRLIDRELGFSKSKDIKKLKDIIKSHRSIIEKYIAMYFKAAKENKILNRDEVFESYNKECYEIANTKFVMFKKLNAFVTTKRNKQ